jgi:hypothetical protein
MIFVLLSILHVPFHFQLIIHESRCSDTTGCLLDLLQAIPLEISLIHQNNVVIQQQLRLEILKIYYRAPCNTLKSLIKVKQHCTFSREIEIRYFDEAPRLSREIHRKK